jgi:hypothetical protein
MANNDEEATKKDFVEAYFEELERKIAFLRDLEAQGHEDEAQLLALVYLDGLSNWLRHPSDGAARNFSSVVIEHGQDAQFPLIIVHWLVNALPWKSAPSGAEHAIRQAVAAMDEYAAQTRDELLCALRVGLTANQLSWLEAEIWRGSVANAAYVSLRSPGIHQLATHGLSFSESTWQGMVLERVGLERLLRALEGRWAPSGFGPPRPPPGQRP